jgi:hypothetical protein
MDIYNEGFKEIYRKIQALEKQNLQSSPSITDEETSIQLEIRALYHNILLVHPAIVVAKSIDTLLWKHCFHKKIEAYRKQIRAMTANLDSKYKDRDVHAVAQSFAQFRSEDQLLHLTSALQAFLVQALTFYQALIAEFESKRGATVYNDDYIKRQIHFSLLYLGDVTRYSEIHRSSSSSSTSKQQKDWSVCERYYMRARQAMPGSGNPYNQASFT